jgi:hypothetical protein
VASAQNQKVQRPRYMCTDKKENNIVLIYKEIQNRAVGNYTYVEGLPIIYDKMRKYLTIYEEAVSHI